MLAFPVYPFLITRGGDVIRTGGDCSLFQVRTGVAHVSRVHVLISR